jgi:hypothetical protein
MRVVLRTMSEEERRVIAPHVEARQTATAAIRAYTTQLAPGLMARPGVEFDIDTMSWCVDVVEPGTAAAAPRSGEGLAQGATCVS